jgi:hypothetical protein
MLLQLPKKQGVRTLTGTNNETQKEAVVETLDRLLDHRSSPVELDRVGIQPGWPESDGAEIIQLRRGRLSSTAREPNAYIYRN